LKKISSKKFSYSKTFLHPTQIWLLSNSVNSSEVKHSKIFSKREFVRRLVETKKRRFFFKTFTVKFKTDNFSLQIQIADFQEKN